MTLGIPELIIIFVMSAVWVIPAAAAVWALITLQRIRVEQRAVQVKLDTIERLLQRS